MGKESSVAEWERYRIAQAESWLSSCKRLVDYERSMRELADSQREMADGISGIDYTKAIGKTSPKTDTIPETVARCMEVASDFEALIADISEKRSEAARALATMPSKLEATVLTRHYLLGQTWESICVEISYSWRGVMNLRRRALLAAYDVMPHRERDPRHQAL